MTCYTCWASRHSSRRVPMKLAVKVESYVHRLFGWEAVPRGAAQGHEGSSSAYGVAHRVAIIGKVVHDVCFLTGEARPELPGRAHFTLAAVNSAPCAVSCIEVVALQRAAGSASLRFQRLPFHFSPSVWSRSRWFMSVFHSSRNSRNSSGRAIIPSTTSRMWSSIASALQSSRTTPSSPLSMADS